MKITAIAPNRIDLAGGTLDIYPLDLFLGGGITVNAAIGVQSRVEIEVREDSEIVLYSEDLKVEERFDGLSNIKLNGPLDLIARAVAHFRPPMGVEVRTKNDAPMGSGLGASSTLLVAACHALQKLVGTKYSYEEIIQLCANLEAQSIHIPTGRQDYYPATYGGVNAIWFEVEGGRVEPLFSDSAALCSLQERITLCFTGETRFSGASNWNMMKCYIDDEGQSRRQFAAIKKTAIEVRDALKAKDFDGFSGLMAQEWENRKSLAEGVTTPKIDQLVAAAAEAGAISSKICGAGGGGCMISCSPPEKKEAVSKALQEAGAQDLGLELMAAGVRIFLEP